MVIAGAELVPAWTVVTPVAESVVNAPDEAELEPIATPSAVPPLMSAVVRTAELRVTTPVQFAIEPAAVPSLALRFVTSRLVVSTVVAFKFVVVTAVLVKLSRTRVIAPALAPAPSE